MKTAKIILQNVKDSDGWSQLVRELQFEKFEKENPELDEEELNDKFYTERISSNFEYGEIANLEIEFDENLKIIGGKLI